MTTSTTTQPRRADGQFGEKPTSAAEIQLDDTWTPPVRWQIVEAGIDIMAIKGLYWTKEVAAELKAVGCGFDQMYNEWLFDSSWEADVRQVLESDPNRLGGVILDY